MRPREFDLVVQKALRQLPASVRDAVRHVHIETAAQPSRAIMRQAGVSDPLELFGWYEGTPLAERSADFGMAAPDRILIFQAAHEAACRNRSELREQVQITVRHEVGHYLGLDEEALDRLGLG